jgi:sugar phosphate isomerase/epimerase
MSGLFSCKTRSDKKPLTFKDYPDLRLGFSTQNFLKAMPLNVESLSELIEYASGEGYQFVEVRDQFVDLTNDDCKALAAVGIKNKIDLIYVFNKNPLDSGYFPVFEKALANVLVFQGPGILRALASKSEFEADAGKKGWTRDELTRLARISDSCAAICKSKNIRFVFENSNEAFFGDSLTYFGLADLFSNTTGTGLQLDIANLFRKTARVSTDPQQILKYLPSLGNRWVETHLKTVQEGEAQTILTDNPIPVEKILELMGKQNVEYAALELTAVENKQQCFDNHTKSIQYLKDKGLLGE